MSCNVSVILYYVYSMSDISPGSLHWAIHLICAQPLLRNIGTLQELLFNQAGILQGYCHNWIGILQGYRNNQTGILQGLIFWKLEFLGG